VPSLFVTCRRCRAEFASGLARTGPLETLSVFGLRHRCPRCGAVGAYFTPEYHFADGVCFPRGPAPPTWLAVAESQSPGESRSDPERSGTTARAPYGWLLGRGLSLG
jgi:hypothetical protein